MRGRMSAGLLLALVSLPLSGCLTKQVHNLGYVQESFVGVDEIRASDARRELVIEYDVFLVEDQEQLGGEGESASVEGVVVPRRLIVPYEDLPVFEYVALEALTQQNVRSLLFLAPNTAHRAIGPYGDAYRDPRSVQPQALWCTDALGDSMPADARSISMWRGDFYEFTSQDWRRVSRVLKEGKALVGHGIVVLARDQRVYVFRLPLRAGDRPWAVPARVALYPLTATVDYVLIPAGIAAAGAGVIGIACIVANPDILGVIIDSACD